MRANRTARPFAIRARLLLSSRMNDLLEETAAYYETCGGGGGAAPAPPATVPDLLDGFVKSPDAALRFTFRHCGVHNSTPHSSGFARLACGTFYEAVRHTRLLRLITRASYLLCSFQNFSAPG